MHPWIFAAQTTPVPNVIDLIFKGLADNPQNVVLAVGLVIMYFATRSMRDELSKSRDMLNGILAAVREERAAEDNQQQIALNMATNAINKFDGLATSINEMTGAMREQSEAQVKSSANHLAASVKTADAHVATTQMLVNRIADMDKQRAEDEMYANDRLMVQIDNKLTLHEEKIGVLIGTILAEAHALHEGTRNAIAAHIAAQPAPAPQVAVVIPSVTPDKSETQTP